MMQLFIFDKIDDCAMDKILFTDEWINVVPLDDFIRTLKHFSSGKNDHSWLFGGIDEYV